MECLGSQLLAVVATIDLACNFPSVFSFKCPLAVVAAFPALGKIPGRLDRDRVHDQECKRKDCQAH